MIFSSSFDHSPIKESLLVCIRIIHIRKVMVDDSRNYNLLEEGKEYFVSIDGVKTKDMSDFLYTFNQLALPDGTQMIGDGVIDE